MNHFIIITVFYFIFSLSSCKRSGVAVSGTISLRDKSHAEIKSTLIGNWKIHYGYGGITGDIYTPTPDSYFKVKANDSVYLTLNNSLVAANSATFTRLNTAFGYDAWAIEFNAFGGFPYSWLAEMLKSDSLVLNDNYINGSAYVMTRIP
jgi:preprotein translocase subunit YajC